MLTDRSCSTNVHPSSSAPVTESEACARKSPVSSMVPYEVAPTTGSQRPSHAPTVGRSASGAGSGGTSGGKWRGAGWVSAAGAAAVWAAAGATTNTTSATTAGAKADTGPRYQFRPGLVNWVTLIRCGSTHRPEV